MVIRFLDSSAVNLRGAMEGTLVSLDNRVLELVGVEGRFTGVFVGLKNARMVVCG